MNDLVDMIKLWLELSWSLVKFKFLLPNPLHFVACVIQLVLQTVLLLWELLYLSLAIFIFVDLPCDLLPGVSHLCLHIIFLLIQTHIVVPHVIVSILIHSCLLFKCVQFLLQLVSLNIH